MAMIILLCITFHVYLVLICLSVHKMLTLLELVMLKLSLFFLVTQTAMSVCEGCLCVSVCIVFFLKGKPQLYHLLDVSENIFIKEEEH